jgi:peptide/nickel transport system ATP-binding protein
MLKLNNVSKIYHIGTFGGKKLYAVNNVTLDIGEKEIVSLIGESGSGKSTIGKMILKIISISSGSITFNGEDISKYKGSAVKNYYRTVQGVFQDPFSSYNPIFKADRIFSFIREEYYPHISNEEWNAKLNNSLAVVGLNPEHVLNKFPHQLSGGQLQRFLIARALLLDIKFLVADEIISMLDASTRIDVLNLLADLRKLGLSILFITHDLSLAHYISDKVVILYRGFVVERGEAEKIFTNSMHPYTQMLISAVPGLEKKWGGFDVNVEHNVNPIGINVGCVYYGRCPFADQQCAQKQPDLVEVEPNHFVACYHTDKWAKK